MIKRRLPLSCAAAFAASQAAFAQDQSRPNPGVAGPLVGHARTLAAKSHAASLR